MEEKNEYSYFETIHNIKFHIENNDTKFNIFSSLDKDNLVLADSILEVETIISILKSFLSKYLDKNKKYETKHISLKIVTKNSIDSLRLIIKENKENIFLSKQEVNQLSDFLIKSLNKCNLLYR